MVRILNEAVGGGFLPGVLVVNDSRLEILRVSGWDLWVSGKGRACFAPVGEERWVAGAEPVVRLGQGDYERRVMAADLGVRRGGRLAGKREGGGRCLSALFVAGVMAAVLIGGVMAVLAVIWDW